MLAVRRRRVDRRHRRSALAERALHHHGVEPAAELEADIRMSPDHLKPCLLYTSDAADE